MIILINSMVCVTQIYIFHHIFVLGWFLHNASHIYYMRFMVYIFISDALYVCMLLIRQIIHDIYVKTERV